MDIISDNFYCEEQYEELRKPNLLASSLISKIFGQGRFFKLYVGL